MNKVMELVSFRLKAGVSANDLLATNDALQVFLQQQDGFLYRSLSCDKKGYWFDIAYWRDRRSAEVGGEKFRNSDIGQTLCALIDMNHCIQHCNLIQDEAFVREQGLQ